MSTATLSQGGGAHQYYCHQCERHVAVAPPPSPTADLVCPSCQGGFLEETDSAPPANPIPSIFFGNQEPVPVSPRRGLPDPSSGDDLAAFLGTRSPQELNPFSFLNNLRARGANIQLVFESPGGGLGGGADLRLPANLGDYFMGHGLEQLIQQLAENDPNRYGTPPASKAAVEGLPGVKITPELMGSDSSQCAVCKDRFELNEEEVKQMPCKHIYHKDCILPWLEMHNSCPVCRFELPTDDPEYENRKLYNNDNSQQTPVSMGRRLRRPFPSMFRGFGSQAGTSNSGGGGGRNSNNNNNNNNSNHSDGGSSNNGAREEDLD